MKTMTQLAGDLAEGTITSSEIVGHYLDQIARFDDSLNAFVALNDEALAEAAASDDRWRRGRQLSPLDGLPMAVKDNLLVRGLPATWGSKAFEHYIPDHDEIPIALLRDAGVIFLGKTNTPELAMAGATTNDLFGATRNPWNTSLTPGGSSGGSVAAVAGGLAPFALGTDGGGSTRRPAAHTGLVGYKPSIGRVPRGGGFPSLIFDLEVVGLIGLDVEDIRLVMTVLGTPDPQDAQSMPFDRWLPEVATADPGKLRIAAYDHIGASPVDPALQQALRLAVEELAILGHDVEAEGDLGIDVGEVTSWSSACVAEEFAKFEADRPDFFTTVGEPIRVLHGSAGEPSSTRTRQAIQSITAFRDQMAAIFAGADVLITPTTAAQPWPVGKAYPDRIGGSVAGPRDHAVFTGWVNVAGLPAVSLPIGTDVNGLPMGVQLIAGPMKDELLISLASSLRDRLVHRAYDPDRWFPVLSR
jgi:aspartyl-tRNA(Asn)/glutamyl-tRNA(Gln) amidotransferase subunit A